MPPKGTTSNEACKVTLNEDDAIQTEKQNKKKGRQKKKKLQAGGAKEMKKISKLSSKTEKKEFSKNQTVWYTSKSKEPQQAEILRVDKDGSETFYTIQLIKNGREKQTDGHHLESLGLNDKNVSKIQSRFKTGQMVFHRANDGAPVYLAQIAKVHNGDGQPLYDIKLQGVNVEKSSIKEAELLDMDEVPGVPEGQCPSASARSARKTPGRSKSPTRIIRKVLSSEGLREIKRGIKKGCSMDGLQDMKRSLAGKVRDLSRDRLPVKATPAASPMKRSKFRKGSTGVSTKSSTSRNSSFDDSARKSSIESSTSREVGSRPPKPKKTRSMDGLREMVQRNKSNVSASREEPGRRARLKKTRSMEGVQEMAQGSRSAKSLGGPVRRKAPSSVRSHRAPVRNQQESARLDRERGVVRSKSMEGKELHPRHLRRPMGQNQRLSPGPPSIPTRGVNRSRSWNKEAGDIGAPVPPSRAAPAGMPRRRQQVPPGNLPNSSHHSQAQQNQRPNHHTLRSRAAKGLPNRQDSANSAKYKQAQSPRSTGSLRKPAMPSQKLLTRTLPPPRPPILSTPPIRVKNAQCDSDSEESSMSSVSWQDKPRSSNRPPSSMPPKREAPKPTEIMVDMDDASSVSSTGDSSWESSRERTKSKPASMQRQWQQQQQKAKPSTKKTSGENATAKTEIIVETVYSSDESDM